MIARLLVVQSLFLAACTQPFDEPADPIDECATCAGGKADDLEGSCDAEIVVQVANESTLDQLDVDAALNIRAARNLVDARANAPFETLADVDAVPFVGASAIAAMLEFGRAQGRDCAPDSCETDVVVVVANEATFAQLDDDAGLDARAARGIVENRPFGTVAEVDAVPFVGASALAHMREFGNSVGLGCESGALAIISDLDKTVIPPQQRRLRRPSLPRRCSALHDPPTRLGSTHLRHRPQPRTCC